MSGEAGLIRRCAAEFVGTFFLVFIGCGACIAHHGHPGDITHVGVALAFGGVVMCVVYATGHISGAHINPAVTLAFAASRHFPLRAAGPYIAAQCLGAVLASGAVYWIRERGGRFVFTFDWIKWHDIQWPNRRNHRLAGLTSS